MNPLYCSTYSPWVVVSLFPLVRLINLPSAYPKFTTTTFRFNLSIINQQAGEHTIWHFVFLSTSLWTSNKYNSSYQQALFLQPLCCNCSFSSAPPPPSATAADRRDGQSHVWDPRVLIPRRTNSQGLCFYREFVQGKPKTNIHFTLSPIDTDMLSERRGGGIIYNHEVTILSMSKPNHGKVYQYSEHMWSIYPVWSIYNMWLCF